MKPEPAPLTDADVAQMLALMERAFQRAADLPDRLADAPGVDADVGMHLSRKLLTAFQHARLLQLVKINYELRIVGSDHADHGSRFFQIHLPDGRRFEVPRYGHLDGMIATPEHALALAAFASTDVAGLDAEIEGNTWTTITSKGLAILSEIASDCEAILDVAEEYLTNLGKDRLRIDGANRHLPKAVPAEEMQAP